MEDIDVRLPISEGCLSLVSWKGIKADKNEGWRMVGSRLKSTRNNFIILVFDDGLQHLKREDYRSSNKNHR